VERWHKTLRREFLDGKVFDSLDNAQAQLDAWVHTYNYERPHQSIGRVPPFERFKLAATTDRPARPLDGDRAGEDAATTRRVSAIQQAMAAGPAVTEMTEVKALIAAAMDTLKRVDQIKARDVSKNMSYRVETYNSRDLGALGFVDEDRVTFYR